MTRWATRRRGQAPHRPLRRVCGRPRDTDAAPDVLSEVRGRRVPSRCAVPGSCWERASQTRTRADYSSKRPSGSGAAPWKPPHRGLKQALWKRDPGCGLSGPQRITWKEVNKTHLLVLFWDRTRRRTGRPRTAPGRRGHAAKGRPLGTSARIPQCPERPFFRDSRELGRSVSEVGGPLGRRLGAGSPSADACCRLALCRAGPASWRLDRCPPALGQRGCEECWLGSEKAGRTCQERGDEDSWKGEETVSEWMSRTPRPAPPQTGLCPALCTALPDFPGTAGGGREKQNDTPQ